MDTNAILNGLRQATSVIEATATDALSSLGCWLAPVPSAALVAQASVEHLGWSNAIGLTAGAIVEVLGLTATSTALTLWDYNEGRRKTDRPAPFWLAAVLVGFYYVSTIGLTVLLDIAPSLARFAPALFPTLALVGTVNLALRAQHRRWLAAIAQEKAERQHLRQAKRQSSRQAAVVGMSKDASNNGKIDANLDVLQAGRMSKRDARLDTLLTFYTDNPNAGPSDAARAVGVSRQTIYVYNAELEQAGKLRKNGAGWEVR
jgi:hypothetical protein